METYDTKFQSAEFFKQKTNVTKFKNQMLQNVKIKGNKTEGLLHDKKLKIFKKTNFGIKIRKLILYFNLQLKLN